MGGRLGVESNSDPSAKLDGLASGIDHAIGDDDPDLAVLGLG